MATTPLRAVRIDDDLWDRLQAKAVEEDTTSSEIIRRLIDEYTK